MCKVNVILPVVVGMVAMLLCKQKIAFVQAGVGNSPPRCQDVDGDGASNLADAIVLLNWLFRGSPQPSCQSKPSGAEGLPDTGQRTCYALNGNPIECGFDCVGQDGSYETGCPPEGRFADNGDGTVTDHCTGLMWQKDSGDTNGDGKTGVEDVGPWCDALFYCENLTLAGHDDWRLPNVRELLTVIDYGYFDPGIDPVFGSPISPHYWSCTSYAGNPSAAWKVIFGRGQIAGVCSTAPKGVPYFAARAVRTASVQAEVAGASQPCQDIDSDGASNVTDAVYLLNWLFLGGSAPACQVTTTQYRGLPDTGQAECYDPEGNQRECETGCFGQDGVYETGCPPQDRFTNNGDGTVTDNCTGLMWQKDTADMNLDGKTDVNDGVAWCDAMNYCYNLAFAGHDDWRLPNVRELHSIVDYGSFDPAIDPVFGVIDPINPGSVASPLYWSSTSYAGNPASAWSVHFISGPPSAGTSWTTPKENAYLVRAVRMAR